MSFPKNTCINLINKYSSLIERTVHTHVNSVQARLNFLFNIRIDVKETPLRIDIHFFISPKQGILFCNKSVYSETIKKIPDEIKHFNFNKIIGIEVDKFKELYKNPNLLLKNIEQGKYGIPFRTEIENYTIMNHLTIDTSNVLTIKDLFFFTGDITDNCSTSEIITYDSVFRKFKKEAKQRLKEKYEEPVFVFDHSVMIGTHKRTRVLSHHVLYTKTNQIVPPGYVVDHINGDITDNDIENLRVITRGKNLSIALKERPKMKDRKYTKQTKKKMSISISEQRKQAILNDKLVSKQKLTYSIVKHYRELYEQGKITRKQIRLELGVNESTVTRFLNYTTFPY